MSTFQECTKVHVPKDQCGKILADADLAYVGTRDYVGISGLLFDELKYINPILDQESWISS